MPQPAPAESEDSGPTKGRQNLSKSKIPVSTISKQNWIPADLSEDEFESTAWWLQW